jgi:hypothetical protein
VRLREVSPYATRSDGCDQTCRDAKAPCEVGPGKFAVRADLNDLGFRELRPVVTNALPNGVRLRTSPVPVAARLATLGVSVRGIVRLRSEEQVRRVHAARVVAARAVVEDAEPRRNRAAVQFPREAVRQNALPLSPKAAIAEVAEPRRPKPASLRAAGAINLRPEAWFDRARRRAVLRDVSCRTVLQEALVVHRTQFPRERRPVALTTLPGGTLHSVIVSTHLPAQVP